MPLPNTPPLQFPPLSRTPVWITVVPPAFADLQTVRQGLATELTHLLFLQRILSLEPSPGIARLCKLEHRTLLKDVVLASLRALHYPAEWTDWIDTARSLAQKAWNELYLCQQTIDRLKWLAEAMPEYSHQLNTAREAGSYAYHYAQMLQNHFEDLPGSPSYTQHPSHRSAQPTSLSTAIRQRLQARASHTEE
jgi:hypothetical protein